MPADRVPTPIRVALGIAATAAEEARKLPETLPNAVTTVPMAAVSTALQASLKLQQRLAALAVKGDEVLALLRPPSEDAPAWATFDDDPIPAAAQAAQPRAAFDRVDYEHPGLTEFTEESDEHPSAPAATETSGAKAVPKAVSKSAPKAAPPAPTKAPAGKRPAKKTTAKKAATEKATARNAPAKKAAAKKAAPKKATAQASPARPATDGPPAE